MRTYSAKPADIQHDWFIIDASGKTLGRLVFLNQIIMHKYLNAIFYISRPFKVLRFVTEDQRKD